MALGSTCHSLVPLHTVPDDVKIGMCFTAPACNTSEQITCHRYKATKVTSSGSAAHHAYSTLHAAATDASSRKSSGGTFGQGLGTAAEHFDMLDIMPMKMRREKGYYKVYSSMFDGNSSDTFMRLR